MSNKSNGIVDAVVGFFVTYFVILIVYSVIRVVSMVLYYMIRTQIDRIIARREKKKAANVVSELGRVTMYKGEVINRA